MSETRLYNDDCLKAMADIESGSVNLILCDLPRKTAGSRVNSLIPLHSLWKEYRRVLHPNGSVLLFGKEPFASVLRLSNPSMYKYDWVFESVNPLTERIPCGQPVPVHDTVSVFHDVRNYGFSEIIVSNMKRLGLTYSEVTAMFPSRNGFQTGWLSNKISGKQFPSREQWSALCKLFGIEDEYDKLAVRSGVTFNDVQVCGSVKPFGKENKTAVFGKPRDTNAPSSRQRSVVRFRKMDSERVNVTERAIEFLIKTHSNKGDIVLDNCMGDGDVGVACVNANRNFIGIEISKPAFDRAKRRISDAQVRLFL